MHSFEEQTPPQTPLQAPSTAVILCLKNHRFKVACSLLIVISGVDVACTGGKQVRWATDSARVSPTGAACESLPMLNPTLSASSRSYVDYIFNYKIILVLSISLTLLVSRNEVYINQNAAHTRFASLIRRLPLLWESWSTCELQQAIPPQVT